MYMAIQFLVLQLQLHNVIFGPVKDSLEVDPDSCHEVISALAILVPDGNHKALCDNLVSWHLKRNFESETSRDKSTLASYPKDKVVIPIRIQSLILGVSFLIVKLEPSLLADVIQQVAESIGVLTPPAIETHSPDNVDLEGPIIPPQ